MPGPHPRARCRPGTPPAGDQRVRDADVDDDDARADLPGERVDHRAAGQEVGDHLGGDLLRPRGHALGVHAVVAGEDRDRGRLRHRRRALARRGRRAAPTGPPARPASRAAWSAGPAAPGPRPRRRASSGAIAASVVRSSASAVARSGTVIGALLRCRTGRYRGRRRRPWRSPAHRDPQPVGPEAGERVAAAHRVAGRRAARRARRRRRRRPAPAAARTAPGGPGRRPPPARARRAAASRCSRSAATPRAATPRLGDGVRRARTRPRPRRPASRPPTAAARRRSRRQQLRRRPST